jgi:Rrf2 family protein
MPRCLAGFFQAVRSCALRALSISAHQFLNTGKRQVKFRIFKKYRVGTARMPCETWVLAVVHRLREAVCQRTKFIRLLQQMKLSKESRYAIEGLLVLAKKQLGVPVQLRNVAAAAGVSPSFLAKIFQKLNRANVVISSRGAVRGYTLARQPNAIKIAEVFTAVEGRDIFDRCIFSSDHCGDRSPCPLHFEWTRMRQALIRRLQKTTLADVAVKNAPHYIDRSRRQSRGGASQ